MIILFTDFGADDIYVGQVKARMLQTAPRGTTIVDLLHCVPDFDPHAGAHLLAALNGRFPKGAVFFAVIDPGVGGERGAAVLEADWLAPSDGLDVNFGADDIAQIIYIDHYGNAMTGLRSGTVDRGAAIEAVGRRLEWGRVFSEVPTGTAFWYENSVGLVEIAVNQGSAAAQLGLSVGDEVSILGSA